MIIQARLVKELVAGWGTKPQKQHAKELGISYHTYLNWAKNLRRDGVKLKDCRKRKINWRDLAQK